MSKDKQSYIESRQKRQEILNYYGFMPFSVLRIPKRSSIKVIQYQEETQENAQYTNRYKDTIDKKSPFWVSGKGSRAGVRYSIMPTSLVEFCIKYYGKKDDLYLDPFAGQGVQLQVAKYYNIDYIGYDVCHKFVVFMEQIIDKIDDGKSLIKVHEEDARLISDSAKDWSFCFTSPPYWDIEFYDESPKQAGIGKTYPEFLNIMYEIYKRMFDLAKSGAIVCINVNDFRKDKKLYTYHSDTIDVLRRAGFEIMDIGILDTGVVSGLAKCFAVSFNTKKMLPKTHEYLIIGGKK